MQYDVAIADLPLPEERVVAYAFTPENPDYFELPVADFVLRGG
jgi:hypothetical protein